MQVFQTLIKRHFQRIFRGRDKENIQISDMINIIQHHIVPIYIQDQKVLVNLRWMGLTSLQATQILNNLIKESFQRYPDQLVTKQNYQRIINQVFGAIHDGVYQLILSDHPLTQIFQVASRSQSLFHSEMALIIAKVLSTQKQQKNLKSVQQAYFMLRSVWNLDDKIFKELTTKEIQKIQKIFTQDLQKAKKQYQSHKINQKQYQNLLQASKIKLQQNLFQTSLKSTQDQKLETYKQYLQKAKIIAQKQNLQIDESKIYQHWLQNRPKIEGVEVSYNLYIMQLYNKIAKVKQYLQKMLASQQLPLTTTSFYRMVKNIDFTTEQGKNIPLQYLKSYEKLYNMIFYQQQYNSQQVQQIIQDILQADAEYKKMYKRQQSQLKTKTHQALQILQQQFKNKPSAQQRKNQKFYQNLNQKLAKWLQTKQTQIQTQNQQLQQEDYQKMYQSLAKMQDTFLGVKMSKEGRMLDEQRDKLTAKRESYTYKKMSHRRQQIISQQRLSFRFKKAMQKTVITSQKSKLSLNRLMRKSRLSARDISSLGGNAFITYDVAYRIAQYLSSKSAEIYFPRELQETRHFFSQQQVDKLYQQMKRRNLSYIHMIWQDEQRQHAIPFLIDVSTGQVLIQDSLQLTIDGRKITNQKQVKKILEQKFLNSGYKRLINAILAKFHKKAKISYKRVWKQKQNQCAAFASIFPYYQNLNINYRQQLKFLLSQIYGQEINQQLIQQASNLRKKQLHHQKKLQQVKKQKQEVQKNLQLSNQQKKQAIQKLQQVKIQLTQTYNKVIKLQQIRQVERMQARKTIKQLQKIIQQQKTVHQQYIIKENENKVIQMDKLLKKKDKYKKQLQQKIGQLQKLSLLQHSYEIKLKQNQNLLNLKVTQIAKQNKIIEDTKTMQKQYQMKFSILQKQKQKLKQNFQKIINKQISQLQKQIKTNKLTEQQLLQYKEKNDHYRNIQKMYNQIKQQNEANIEKNKKYEQLLNNKDKLRQQIQMTIKMREIQLVQSLQFQYVQKQQIFIKYQQKKQREVNQIKNQLQQAQKQLEVMKQKFQQTSYQLEQVWKINKTKKYQNENLIQYQKQKIKQLQIQKQQIVDDYKQQLKKLQKVTLTAKIWYQDKMKQMQRQNKNILRNLQQKLNNEIRKKIIAEKQIQNIEIQNQKMVQKQKQLQRQLQLQKKAMIILKDNHDKQVQTLQDVKNRKIEQLQQKYNQNLEQMSITVKKLQQTQKQLKQASYQLQIQKEDNQKLLQKVQKLQIDKWQIKQSLQNERTHLHSLNTFLQKQQKLNQKFKKQIKQISQENLQMKQIVRQTLFQDQTIKNKVQQLERKLESGEAFWKQKVNKLQVEKKILSQNYDKQIQETKNYIKQKRQEIQVQSKRKKLKFQNTEQMMILSKQELQKAQQHVTELEQKKKKQIIQLQDKNRIYQQQQDVKQSWQAMKQKKVFLPPFYLYLTHKKGMYSGKIKQQRVTELWNKYQKEFEIAEQTRIFQQQKKKRQWQQYKLAILQKIKNKIMISRLSSTQASIRRKMHKKIRRVKNTPIFLHKPVNLIGPLMQYIKNKHYDQDTQIQGIFQRFQYMFKYLLQDKKQIFIQVLWQSMIKLLEKYGKDIQPLQKYKNVILQSLKNPNSSLIMNTKGKISKSKKIVHKPYISFFQKQLQILDKIGQGQIIPRKQIQINSVRQYEQINVISPQMKQIISKITGHVRQQLSFVREIFRRALINKKIKKRKIAMQIQKSQLKFAIQIKIRPDSVQIPTISIPLKINSTMKAEQIMQYLSKVIRKICKYDDYQNVNSWYVTDIKMKEVQGIQDVISQTQGQQKKLLQNLLRYQSNLYEISQQQYLSAPFNTCWQKVINFINRIYNSQYQCKEYGQLSYIKKICLQKQISLIKNNKIVLQYQSKYSVVIQKQQIYEGKLCLRSHIFITSNYKKYLHYMNQKEQKLLMQPKKSLKYEKKIKKIEIYLDVQCFADKNQQFQQQANIQQIYLIGCLVIQQQQILQNQFFYIQQGDCDLQVKQFKMYRSFWSWFQKITQQRQCRVWAYNGMNYDYQYLIKPLFLQKWEKLQVLGDKNSPKAYIYTRQEGDIYFYDTKTIIVDGKLSTNAQKYNKIYNKLDFDIKAISEQQHFFSQKDKILQYNAFDCLAMWQLIRNTYKALWQYVVNCAKKRGKLQFIDKQQFYRKFTIPSMSYYLFSQVFLDFPTQSDGKYKQLFTKNYFGGCTQVWNHVAQQNMYQLDVNSQYPSIMINQQMPVYFQQQNQVTNLFEQLQKIKNGQRQTYFYQVQKFHLNNNACTIGVTNQNSLFYPNQFQGTQKWMWGIELKQHLNNGQYIQVKKYLKYSSINPFNGQKWNCFKNYVQQAYNYRLQAKKNKNDLADKTGKLFMNSLYGKLAQKLFQIVMINQFDEQYIMNQQKHFHVGNFVRLASFITAGARGLLTKYINNVGTDNVWYMDTDSLYTNEQGYKKALSLQIIDNNKIGYLKCQRRLKRCFFIAKKMYVGLKDDLWNYQNGLIKQKQYIQNIEKPWTLKSKGINSNQNQSVMRQLYQNCIRYYDMGRTLWNKCFTLQKVCTIMKMKSVCWQKQKKQISGVKRYKLMKKVNFIFQRRPLKQGKTEPLKRYQYVGRQNDKFNMTLQIFESLPYDIQQKWGQIVDLQ